MKNDDTDFMIFPRLERAMRHGVSYRAMRCTDLGFLSRLYRSTREEEMSILPWGEDQKRHFIYMQFKAQHEHYQKHYPDALWMVVDVEKMPAGRLYIERWSRELRIIDIALLPDFRAKGIGSSILEDLKVEAMESGKKISIHVEKENPAMSLYLRLGFGIIEDKGIYNLLGWPHPS